MRGRPWLVLGVTLAFLLVVTACAGVPDRTFGGSGSVVTDAGGFERAHAVAVQPDGRVVVAGGSVRGDGTRRFVVARYRDDGKPDSTFGTNGLAVFATGVSTDDGATVVLVQPDGMVVAGGASSAGHQLVLARLRAAGRHDPDFGVGGLSILGPDAAIGLRPDTAAAIGRQSSGRIVVGGSGFVVGFTAGGVVDPTFDPAGARPGVLPTHFVHGLLVEPDDRLLVAGAELGDRLRADGTGATPVLPCSSAGPRFCQSYAVVRQVDDGKTVFSASPFDDTTKVGRLDPQGRIDSSFGGDGYVEPGSTYVQVPVGVQRDDVVVALSGSELYRFRPDGSVDRAFGDQGRVVVADHARGIFADAFAIDRDDRAVVVGSRGSDLLVARFTTR
jgi:uncharacterized delta-60 repeat protein